MLKAFGSKLSHKLAHDTLGSWDSSEPSTTAKIQVPLLTSAVNSVSVICQSFHKERLNMLIQSTMVQSGVPSTRHSNSLSGRTVAVLFASGTKR